MADWIENERRQMKEERTNKARAVLESGQRLLDKQKQESPLGKQHDFVDAFGPCSSCGLYVEECMEVPFCTERK